MSIKTEMQRISNALSGVRSGKAAIADAITAKGVDTAQDATFEELAANIGNISGGGVRNNAYTTHYVGQSESRNGLTFTAKVDGSTDVVGNLSGSYTYYVPVDKIKICEVGKTYTLSIWSDGTDCDVQLYFEQGNVQHSQGTGIIVADTVSRQHVTFTINGGTFQSNHMTLMLRSSYGSYASLSNVKLQLEEGDTAHDYVSPWPLSV